jgi:hypothetical protein
MIKNEEQYKITKKALSDWLKTYEQLLGMRTSDAPRWVHEAQLEGARAEVLRLEKQVQEYEHSCPSQAQVDHD